MAHDGNRVKLVLALALIAATGPGAAHSAKSHAANVLKNPQNVMSTVISSPCPAISSPILQPKAFLVANRTSATLACRMRHPAIGGWSNFVQVGAGARLIDRQIDLDEIQVQCKSPARPSAVRLFPGKRYALLRDTGHSEIRIREVVAGQE